MDRLFDKEVCGRSRCNKCPSDLVAWPQDSADGEAPTSMGWTKVAPEVVGRWKRGSERKFSFNLLHTIDSKIFFYHTSYTFTSYDYMLWLFLNIPHTSMVRPLFSPPGVPHNSLGTSCPIHACQLLALEGPPDGKCTSVRERQLQNGGLMLIFEKMPLSSNESTFCIRWKRKICSKILWQGNKGPTFPYVCFSPSGAVERQNPLRLVTKIFFCHEGCFILFEFATRKRERIASVALQCQRISQDASCSPATRESHERQIPPARSQKERMCVINHTYLYIFI